MWKVNSLFVAFVIFAGTCAVATADAGLYSNYQKLFFVEEENSAFGTGRELNALDQVRLCNLQPGQQVNLDASGYPSCDFTGYAQAIMVLIIVPIILCALSLVGCVLYLFCACCSCCGCCMCCCCTKERDLLSNCVMIVVKVLIAGGAAIAAVGLAFMITGSAGVGVGIVEIETTALDLLGIFQERVDNMTAIVAQIPQELFTADISVAIARIATFPAEFKAETENVFNIINQFDQGRQAAILIAGIGCVALVAIGFLLSFFKLRTLMIFLCVLLFLTLFVLWLSLAIHIFASEVVGDMCAEVDILQAQVDAGTVNGSGPLGYFVKCKNNDPNTLGMLGQVEEGRVAALAFACGGLNDTCTYPGVICVNYDPGNCTMDYIKTADGSISISDTVVNCDTGGGNFQTVNNPSQCSTVVGATFSSTNRSLSECAASCDNTDLKGYSQTVVDYVAYIRLFDILYTQFLEVLNCRFVYDAFIDLKDVVCVTFLDAINNIAAGSGVMAGGVSLGVILITYVFTHLPYKK